MMMPQLDPTYFTSQVFWLLLLFLACYLFNYFIFIPKLKASIDKRAEVINKDLKRASDLLEESKKIRLEMESIILNVKIQANAIRENASNEAQALVNNQILEANKEFADYLKLEQEEVKIKYNALILELPNIIEEVKNQVISTIISKYN